MGKIDMKKDLEQQLNLLVECRAAFPNLDSVQVPAIIRILTSTPVKFRLSVQCQVMVILLCETVSTLFLNVCAFRSSW